MCFYILYSFMDYLILMTLMLQPAGFLIGNGIESGRNHIKKESIYKMDSRTKDWINIKFLKNEDLVVCGYILKESDDLNVASIILGIYKDGKLINQGHVTIGMSRKEFDLIRKQRVLNESPFEKYEENAIYFEPTLVCTVTFMERLKMVE